MFQLDYDWDKTWAWLRKFIAKFTTLELWGDAKDGAWVRFKAMQKAMHKYRPAMDQQDRKMSSREGVNDNADNNGHGGSATNRGYKHGV